MMSSVLVTNLHVSSWDSRELMFAHAGPFGRIRFCVCSNPLNPALKCARLCGIQLLAIHSNTPQHSTTSCVKLRISYPTETTGHAYKERFISLLEFAQEPMVDFFSLILCRRSHLEYKMCVCVSIKTIKGWHCVQH